MPNKQDIKTRNILIVDDSKGLIHEIKSYIEKSEIDIKNEINFIFVNNVRDALSEIAKNKIDIIILEIVLPIVNGYHLLDAIKNNNEIHKIVYTKLKGPQDLARLTPYSIDNIFIKQLMKVEDLLKIVSDPSKMQGRIGDIVSDLESQIRSLSDQDVDSQIKVVQCPRCNMILRPNTHFCPNCGQKIY